MSTKKEITKAEVFDDTKITLRSVFDKSNIKYYIPPCKDKFGRYPACVKRVNAQGDMIMSEAERDAWSEGKAVFIPENTIFEVVSGKTYDLTNKEDAAEWEAIKNCPFIAKSRDAKDENGNFIIDGTKSVSPDKPGRNGVAELYIERVGVEARKRVSRKQLIHKACSFIYDDEHGIEGNLQKARLLGKDMRNQPMADVIDYLIQVAEKNPQKIIDLYSGTDTQLRLLFIEAKESKVIILKNKVYFYGDILLGATDDAVIAWMRDPRNKKVLELIKKDTHPELEPIVEEK